MWRTVSAARGPILQTLREPERFRHRLLTDAPRALAGRAAPRPWASQVKMICPPAAIA